MSDTQRKSRYLHIYEQVRQDITAGVYPVESKLPSKRDMADQCGVSVITVEHAYELLAEEGYIEPREKSGYFVVYDSEQIFSVNTAKEGARTLQNDMGRTDTMLSYATYARTARRVMTAYGDEIMQRSPGKGTQYLRSAIASYLQRSRHMTAGTDQIIVGAGAEYLYGLIVKALGRNLVYAIESPSYSKIEQVYRAEGVTLEQLELGRNGIDGRALWSSGADVLHITPYRSYPSGVTATASKKQEYLSWSSERGSLIIEDDAESEFSPLRKPEETLYALGNGESVIYVNTFTRTIGPFLRAAYMVVPEKLAECFEERTGFYACTVPTLEQYIIAELLESGDFARHINRVRRKTRPVGIK